MRLLAALACGALLPFSLAPFGIWPLALVSVGGWFWLLHRDSGRGLLLGWAYGVGKYAVGVSWVYVSIHVYGGAPPLLAGTLVLVFVAALGLFTLANAWLFRLLRSGRLFADALLFAVLLVAFEWILTGFLTGFPWLFLGYAPLDTPLAGLAPVGGVLLVSLVVALGGSCGVVALVAVLERRWRAVLAPAALVLLPWLGAALLYDRDWVEPGEARSVALVQGNIDQSLKWQAENRLPILHTYTGLSEPHWGVDLMIWPEAAVTYLGREADAVIDQLDRRATADGTALLLGIPTVDRLPRGDWLFYNSALGLGTAAGRYRKQRLVPFGEYVPLERWLRGAIEFFDLPMSRMEPGPRRQPLLQADGQHAAMAICYEVVYPELMRAQAARADFLVTISNDAWFGRSIGPLQHLQMARMRALENGRWLLRGTNNGVTAVVDHRGRITAELPQFEAGVLRSEYRSMTGATPYTRHGHVPVLALLAVALAALLWGRRRR